MNIIRIPAVCFSLTLILSMPVSAGAEEPKPSNVPEQTAEPARLAELGKAEYQAGNHEKAFAYYERAIRENSETGVPEKQWLETFGVLCKLLKKQDKFIDTMRQLVLLYPSEQPIDELRKYSKGLEPLLTAPDYSKTPRQTLPIRQETEQQIQLAKQGMLSGNYAGGRMMAEALLLNENLNSVERAVVWILRGIIYTTEDLVVPGAYAYEQALLQPDAPNSFLLNANTALSNIYLQIGKYDLAIARATRSLEMRQDLNATGPDDDVRRL
jgi:tetratricopeptide (TPR) repeat protein